MEINGIIVMDDNHMDDVLDAIIKYDIIVEPSNLHHDLFTDEVLYRLVYLLVKNGFNSVYDVVKYTNDKKINILLTDLKEDVFVNPEVFYFNIDEVL